MDSGCKHFGWRCDGCGSFVSRGDKPGIWIRKQELIDNGVDLDHLPSVSPDNPPVCCHCGSLTGEIHHWAPQALFSDAGDWPRDYLCPACHKLWHSIVTPQLIPQEEVEKDGHQ